MHEQHHKITLEYGKRPRIRYERYCIWLLNVAIVASLVVLVVGGIIGPSVTIGIDKYISRNLGGVDQIRDWLINDPTRIDRTPKLVSAIDGFPATGLSRDVGDRLIAYRDERGLVLIMVVKNGHQQASLTVIGDLLIPADGSGVWDVTELNGIVDPAAVQMAVQHPWVHWTSRYPVIYDLISACHDLLR